MNSINTKIYELTGPYQLVVKEGEIDLSGIKELEVAAETIYSALSPGTEVAAYTGMPPLRPMKVYPRVNGYCNLAKVITTGSKVTAVEKDDLILTHQSHRSAFICGEDEILFKVPASADLKKITAAYLFHLGYNALMEGGCLPGFNVAIIGAGTLGITAAVLANTFGMRTFVLSVQKNMKELFSPYKLVHVSPKSDSFKEWVLKETHKTGIDVVISTSNPWADWEFALEIVRKRGTIITLGFPGRGEGLPATNPLDSKYLFDKQLSIKACGLAIDNNAPAEDVRFTVKRNMQYLCHLIMAGSIDPAIIISEEVKWDKLEDAYKKIAARQPGYYSAILKWKDNE
jgi:threonine dehydrogenase-like Zn-dependent dehydrogenase